MYVNRWAGSDLLVALGLPLHDAVEDSIRYFTNARNDKLPPEERRAQFTDKNKRPVSDEERREVLELIKTQIIDGLAAIGKDIHGLPFDLDRLMELVWVLTKKKDAADYLFEIVKFGPGAIIGKFVDRVSNLEDFEASITSEFIGKQFEGTIKDFIEAPIGDTGNHCWITCPMNSSILS